MHFSEIIKFLSKGLDIHRQVKINDKTDFIAITSNLLMAS